MAIAQVLERHNCLIVTDDIYEKIVYDGFDHPKPCHTGAIVAGQDRYRKRSIKELCHDRLAYRLRARSG